MWHLLAAGTAWGQATVASTGTAWGTLQEAVDHAEEGDTVLVSGALVGDTVVIGLDLVVAGDGTGSYSSSGTAIETLADTTVALEDLLVVGGAGSGIDGGGALELRDVVVTGNAETGGGIWFRGPSLVAERVSIVGATAVAYGGGLSIEGSPLAPSEVVLTDVVFDQTVNGALYANWGSVDCVRCTFLETSGNWAAVLTSNDAPLSLVDSVFVHPTNAVPWLAGAIQASSPIDLLRTTICGAGGGYAVRADAGGTVRNSRILDSDNEALFLTGDWTIENNDILGASSAITARVAPSAIRVTGNLFAGQVYEPLFENDPGLLTDIGYNRFDATPLVTLGLGNLIGVDPAFVSFTDDGDCTNDDLRLQPTSALLDQGDPAVLDPDGSRSDIGATGGPEADPTLHADADGDGLSAAHDCDDGDASIGPATDRYVDADGDGVGAGSSPVLACPGPGSADVGDDCDDGDPTVWDYSTFWRDGDGDGFGDALVPVLSCLHPEVGLAADDTDCDDADSAAHALVEQYADGDGDGFGDLQGDSVLGCGIDPGFTGIALDCDDRDPTVNPDAVELCDGVDQNCVPSDEPTVTSYEDRDGDGFGGGEPTEACDEPGRVPVGGDCDDTVAGVHPGTPEACDGVDEDCDGAVDDGLDCEEATVPDEDPVTPDEDVAIPVEVAGSEAEPSRTCGCSSSAGGNGLGGLLAVVLLAVRARRRA